jgi:ATP-dependent RNA helicase RhlE
MSDFLQPNNMQLKKINTELQQALQNMGLVEANELQLETYSVLKSGQPLVVCAPEKSGKTTAIQLHVIQRLQSPKDLSPRVLIMLADDQSVRDFQESFASMNACNKLRSFYVFDKTDIDEEKNQISLGIDIIIGTPNKLNALFAGAGFDVNQLQMVIFDDFDLILKNRFEPIVNRLLESIHKGQRLFFCSQITERVEAMAFKWIEEPEFFELD